LPEIEAGTEVRWSFRLSSSNIWVLRLTSWSATWFSGASWPYLLTYSFSPLASVACVSAALT